MKFIVNKIFPFPSCPTLLCDFNEGALILRYPKVNDAKRWVELRRKNAAWLYEWEPSVENWYEYHTVRQWKKICQQSRNLRLKQRQIMFIIELNGVFIGQIVLGSIIRGAICSAWCGYWLDYDHWGKGVATQALSSLLGYAYQGIGLHRIEATVQEKNIASIKVLEKNCFNFEGRLRKYMLINGQWLDHLLYAITVEDWKLQTAM